MEDYLGEYEYHNKGALLSEPDPEETDRQRRTMRKIGLWGTVGAVALIVIAPVLFTLVDWFDGMCVVMFVIGAVPVLLVAVLMLMGMRQWQPNRVFENGLEVTGVNGKVTFKMWSEFTSAELPDEEAVGGSLILKKGEMYAGMISSDMPGFDEWAPMIAERVGSVDEATREVEAKRRYAELPVSEFTPVVVGFISFAIALAVVVFVEVEGLSDATFVTGAMLWLVTAVPIALAIHLLSMGILLNDNVAFSRKKRVSPIFGAIVVAAMLLAYTGVLGGSPFDWKDTEYIYETTDPFDTVLTIGTHVDESLLIDGSVTVREGQELVLRNTTLTFSPAPGHSYGIWVGEGGSLVMENSSIKSVDPDAGYAFEVHGSARISDSRVVAPAPGRDGPNGDGGLEVYSDDVVIEGTSFESARGNGIMVVDCSPLIRDCDFLYVEDDGIEVRRGTPTVEGCHFRGCGWPMIFLGSDAVVRNCTVEDGQRGIQAVWSNLTVTGCTFRNITGTAIDLESDMGSVVEGNRFVNVYDEFMDMPSHYLTLGLCAGTTYVLGAIGGLYMVYRWYRDRRDHPKEEGDGFLGVREEYP